jgi:hypothetical protein
MPEYTILYHLLRIAFYLSVIFGSIFLSFVTPQHLFHFLTPLRKYEKANNDNYTQETGLAGDKKNDRRDNIKIIT